MIRIIGVLILLTGFSVHGQDEISVIREPGINEPCDETSKLIPTCLFDRPAASNAVELITNDLKVCGCLKKSNKLFEENTPKPESEDAIRKETDRQLDGLASRSGNSSVIQASSSAKTKRDLSTGLLVYGGQETRSKVGKDKDKKLPVINSAITKINQISPENSSWQCITYQEYSVQREIPSENEFFQLLIEPNFKPENWNPDTLLAEYDSASEAEKKNIGLKLTFLSRNPIFQSVMKAKPTEKFSEAKVLAKQKALYEVLKLLAPSPQSTCLQVANSCFNELLTNGNYKKYTDGVSKFLMDFDVIDISSSQAKADYEAELRRITSSGQVLVNSVPTDPVGYFNYLQTANKEVFRECSGKKVKPECYTKFENHCAHIYAIDKRVREGIKLKSSDISSTLREEETVHASMNPSENANFRSFNDKICNDPYANSSGESLNFFQYQAKYCTATARLPECSDRKQLLTKFLADYNVGTVESDKSLRSAFGQIIADRSFQAITEAQVIAANNINETPAELRARFGGLFPDLTPAGKLIPPAVRPGPNTNVASSFSTSIPDYSDITSDSDSTSSSSNSSSGSSFSKSAGGSFAASTNGSGVAGLGDLPKVYDPKLANTVIRQDNAATEDLPVFRNPASVDSSQDDSRNEESNQDNKSQAPLRQDQPQATSNLPGGSGGGGGGGGSAVVSGTAGSAGAGNSAGGNSSGGVIPYSGKKRSPGTAGKGLLFKYGLDENNQPEVKLINAEDQSEVKVSVDKNFLGRIQSNPNALEIGKEDMEKILATPDEEVKLVLEPSDGSTPVIVYAKKDSTGGISFALTPSKAKPKAANVMRVDVLPDVHENIISDPDIYLNQNPTVIQEIMNKEGQNKKLLLQVVSPGKRALVFEVKKKNEYIYSFKRVNP